MLEEIKGLVKDLQPLQIKEEGYLIRVALLQIMSKPHQIHTNTDCRKLKLET